MANRLRPVSYRIGYSIAGMFLYFGLNLSSFAASTLPQESFPAVIETIQRQADDTYEVKHGKAKNKALNWQLRFHDNGVQVDSEAKTAKPFRLSLARYSYNGKLRDVSAAKPTVEKNRVRYSYGSVEAWYINGPLGLEQGFTVPKPMGSDVILEVAANWPAVSAGNAIEFVDGDQRWSYGELQAKDAEGKILPAVLKVNDDRVRIEVATRNARFPVVIDPLLAPKPIKFYSNSTYNRFGNASALSADGKTIFIGGLKNEVYIFQKKISGWAFVQKLTKPANLRCNSTGSLFGNSLALSANGTTALVGASGFVPSSIIGFDYKYFCAGLSVYVKNGSTWVLNKLLTSPEVTVNDAYGSSIALSADGKTALVGAEFTKCAANTNKCGAVYIFERSLNGWVKRARILGPQSYPNHTKGYFGSTTSLSANGLWGLSGARSGTSAWSLGRINGNWKLLQKFSLSTALEFGGALGLSSDGGHALIGAKYANGAANCGGNYNHCGAAYSFKRTGLTFAYESKFTASDAGNYYYFGETLALSGNGLRAAVGANGADCRNGNCGAVYFFVWNGKKWVQQGRYTSPTAGTGGPGLGDKFGEYLTAAADGNSVAVSAKTVDCTAGNDCGAVYLYSPIYP